MGLTTSPAPPSVAAAGVLLAQASALSLAAAAPAAVPLVVTPLAAEARTQLAGLPADVTALPAWPAAAAGARQWHVDSQGGDDAADGRTPATAWRSLARLARVPLQAGDRVLLACGSRWHETLRLAGGGRAGLPVVVSAADTRCAAPPVIDGAVALPAGAWSTVRPGVYRQRLATPPLQLLGGSLPWLPAHHPNIGPQGANWLALAAAGNRVPFDGREVSTRLPVGADLGLPAGQRLGPGTRVRVRTAAYVVDDLPLASHDAGALTVASPTTYAVNAGWGYLLTGQAWMVDSPAEWFHDATTGDLTVQARGGEPRLPTLASVLATGLDLQGLQHVVVEGLHVVNTGVGALLRGSQALTLRNSVLTDLADRGVDAADSRDVILEANRIERTGTDAVFAGGIAATAARGLVVRGNLIRHSGVLWQDGAARTLPRRSYGAILAGQQGQVSDNTLVDVGYIGIRVFDGSRVEGNVVVGACSVLDDCGGIYTHGAGNGSVIRGNLVAHSRGQPAGKPAAARAPLAQGIYLDDGSSGVTVQDNTVVDTDHGLHLHDAAANTVQGNRLHANRVAQVWLQETARSADGAGALRANQLLGNQFAPALATARAVLADSVFASASAFAQFDGNRYLDPLGGRAVSVATAAGVRHDTLDAWLVSGGLLSTQPVEPRGSSASQDGHARYTVAAANLVPNGDLARGQAGWSQWYAAAPGGSLATASCGALPCLVHQAGGGPGLLSSPNFTVEAGRWYRLTIDVAGPPGRVPLLVRRGGGGNNGYESLADRELWIDTGPTLRRQVRLFRATATVRAGDPNTGDLGARVDIEGLSAGTRLSVAGLELVPVTPYAGAAFSASVLNAGPQAADMPCPFAADEPVRCEALQDLGLPGRRVSWPLRVPGRSGVVLRGYEPALLDSDGDGIADFQDRCPGSLSRESVNASGCTLGQR